MAQVHQDIDIDQFCLDGSLSETNRVVCDLQWCIQCHGQGGSEVSDVCKGESQGTFSSLFLDRPNLTLAGI